MPKVRRNCKARTCSGGSLAAAVQASAGLLRLPVLPRPQQPLQPEVAQSCTGQTGPCRCLQHAGEGPPIQLEAALQVHCPQATPCLACTSRQQQSACNMNVSMLLATHRRCLCSRCCLCLQ